MWAIIFSSHLRELAIVTLIAYIVLLIAFVLWCCALTCCLVPRRLRKLLGLLMCAVLFVAIALTVYTLSEAHAIEETRRLFSV
jgi:cytosine/uracil/thiamine/allantoin permease